MDVDRSDSRVSQIGHVLRDQSQPMKARFRALFLLRNLNTDAAVQEIVESFTGETSELLLHEMAYCLGQMQNVHATPFLCDVLADCQNPAVLRHEAAEALGAIGASSTFDPQPTLQSHLQDNTIEVAESCELALARIKYFNDQSMNDDELTLNPYASVDPTPPTSIADSRDALLLRSTLLDPKQSLWDRYRAMFTLRNLGTDYAVRSLADSLHCPTSALFRHEIAYVLGQLQHELAVDDLHTRLADTKEHNMVRHECAEALGAIATPECQKILQCFLQDPAEIVRQSCEVALDMCDYEQSPLFQYATIDVDDDVPSK